MREFHCAAYSSHIPSKHKLTKIKSEKMIKRPNSRYWQPLRSQSLIMLLVARAFGPCLCIVSAVFSAPPHKSNSILTHSLTTCIYKEAQPYKYDAMSIGKILGIRIWHKHERRPQMNEGT